MPDSPLPLDEIEVALLWEENAADFDGVASKHLPVPWLPRTESAARYRSYSSALGDLARPSLFQNLPCYKLLSVNLTSTRKVIEVGRTTFFKGIDESEALAHEFAARVKKKGRAITRKEADRLALRNSLGNEFVPGSRNIIMSISALTLRVSSMGATFFLHSRNSSSVAIAGSLLHLAPSGVFQPTADEKPVAKRDCSPWLTLCREYAEEFLGVEEAQGAAGVALSYEHDKPYSELMLAYKNSGIRIFALGPWPRPSYPLP